MGQPKALLPFGDTTLIGWVARRLRPSFGELLLSAPTDLDLGVEGARVVHDLHPRAGPLAGIEAGLLAAAHEVVFAVACDMPLVTPELARAIVGGLRDHDAAVPVIGGRPEAACAAYAPAAAPRITAALERGERKAATVLKDLDVAWLNGFEAALFRNVNTPDEYRALLDAVR